tara:strand:- start:619 stop:867 length:249 start_codon:yes stop_codon:yes gene_type:complete
MKEQDVDMSFDCKVINDHMLTKLNENQFIDIVAAQNRLCGHSALNDLAWDVFVKLDDQLIATNDLNDQEHNLLNHVSNLLQI